VPAARPLDGHLVLVGLPGAGKSTVGRAVARALGCEFLDFDTEIARRVGMSVADYFAAHGEPAFRALEVALTRELVGRAPMVLAPGGGWVTNAGVMELLRPPGRIIHLRVTPDVALARLARARAVRPLLAQANPAVTIRALWEARQPLYERADAEVNVEVVDGQQLVDSVLALAHGGGSGVG